jgi:hypothetical protein
VIGTSMARIRMRTIMAMIYLVTYSSDDGEFLLIADM